MTAASFVKIDQTQRARPAIRILHVPLVMRHDTNEATNNRKGTKLFGHPHLFKLPSRVDAKDVWNIVRRVVPQDSDFTLHFVDGQVWIIFFSILIIVYFCGLGYLMDLFISGSSLFSLHVRFSLHGLQGSREW